MKSYNTFEDAIKNIKPNTFLFKQFKLNKNYSISDIDSIKKFQSKNKTDIFQYINYNQNIRFFFYIKLNNSKENIDNILNNILNILKFKYDDFIIIQESDTYFLIIHKYIYVDNFESLDYYLFKLNLFNVTLDKNNFVNTINNQNIITFDKYNFSQSIINNTTDLQKLNTNINIKKTYIDSTFLKPIVFDNYDTLFIKSDMGTGKSTATVNYIKDNNINKFLILSCRRTLTFTIYDKLKQENIPVDNYISTNSDKIKISNKLIISPDSLYKIQYPLHNFDFIWIDEGVSFMYYLGNHLFTNQYANKEVIFILEWLVKNCNKLLITDADLNNETINFYLYFRKLYYCHYIIYNKHPTSNKYIIIDEEEEILKSLINNIKNNNNIYICCDTLKKTKFIYDYLINNSISNDLILLYNSESTKNYDKQMYNVNSFWKKFKIVIVSPKVIFGVDFNLNHFHYVYSFYKCTTITVRECFQQMHRIRNIINKTIYIHIYKTKTLNLIDNLTYIKYNLSNYNSYNLFYKKNKTDCDFIFNSIIFNINNQGYKIIDMNNYINYLIIYCISHTNYNLNNFVSIFNSCLN